MFGANQSSLRWTMASNQSKTFGRLIDQIERIREELLTLQEAMEKMESEPAKPRSKKTGK
jgi:GTP1/Obg family GTP-binding protein